MFSFIEARRPSIVIYENIDNIMDNVSGSFITNEDILKSDFASRGYETQTIVANSSDFCLPQDRRRYYLVAVQVVASPSLTFDSRSINDMFKTLRDLIVLCQREAPCLSKVIYPHTHERLQVELEKRQASGRVKQAYSFQTAFAAAAVEGISWSAIRTPAILKQSAWFSTVTAQQQQAACYSVCTSGDPQLPETLLHDVQPSLQRIRRSKNWRTTGMWPCLRHRNRSF